MKNINKPKVELVSNTNLAEYDCQWCQARASLSVHSDGCPLGERYKQMQQLGGIPWEEQKDQSGELLHIKHKNNLSQFFLN